MSSIWEADQSLLRMFAFIISDLANLEGFLRQPWFWLITAFQIWMLVDAIRREEWVWAVLIFLFSGLTAFFYYLMVYRSSPSMTQGFQLPGAHERKRIKELEAQIHHLDKAHHHSQLGDVYFQQGKLEKAEAYYRAAMERDPNDIDTRAHLGQGLLRLQRATEARPLLEAVCVQNPKHDYGHTMMAFAETLTALGQQDAAIAVWQRVLENHSYARARVQLAELYVAKKQLDPARAQLTEALEDGAYAPKFDRHRDRIWMKRAKKLIGQL
ncbi:MAG: tetratricopeptide repeat protein [Verrucomicrobiota bacterium]